jgi:hypothetical protein
MMDDKKRDPSPETERTATDDMVERYRNGARISPATGDPNRSEPTGLPPGMHDSHKSPVAPK